MAEVEHPTENVTGLVVDRGPTHREGRARQIGSVERLAASFQVVRSLNDLRNSDAKRSDSFEC